MIRNPDFDTTSVLSDIMSREPYKVWLAACRIISWGQDPEKIGRLIEYLPQIRAGTEDLDMGGLYQPNQRFINFALRTIEFHHCTTSCPCNLFLEHSFDPVELNEKGHIKILEREKGDWEMNYISLCRKCAQVYRTKQIESGHFSQFTWVKMD